MEKLKQLYSVILRNIMVDNLAQDFNLVCADSITEITKQVAIDFSLWQQRGDCIWVLNDEDHWVHPYTNESMTTEQLFHEFLKTYEL